MPHGRDLTRLETARLRGWEMCEECGTPYQVEDVLQTGSSFLCRWHYARRARLSLARLERSRPRLAFAKAAPPPTVFARSVNGTTGIPRPWWE